MISTILSALPLSSIFALIIKVVLHFLDKAEADKEMKRDFLKFVQAFDDHRKIPVELNKKWKRMVDEQKKQVEAELNRDVANAKLFEHYSDKPNSEL